MFGIWPHIVLQLRQHYDILAATSLLCILGFAVLDYGHFMHGCDLDCWSQQLEHIDEKPMLVLLFVLVFKIILIVILTLFSYLKVKPEVEPSITHVKQRFSRFIVMRLLAAHDEFQHGSQEFQERHAILVRAIHLFRSDAGRLCERNSTQLSFPIEQMLPVEEQEELELLERGYKCVPQLKETDIYRLLLALQLP